MEHEQPEDIKPLRPQTEAELCAAIRDSLIVKSDSGYFLRLAGHEDIIYTDWWDAVEALEETLGLRPFTFDV
jgi:hypothetical protein